MNLIYINVGRSSVFDSQVLALLRYFGKNCFFEKVILLYGYNTESDKKWLENKNTSHITIYYYKNYPNYPLFNYLNRKSLFQQIQSLSIDFSEYFFHIRGELPSYHFKKIMRKLNVNRSQLLTDVRGVPIQELVEYSNLNKISKQFKLQNYRKAFTNLNKDHNISVVSESLKKYLLTTLNINENSVYINPCLADDVFYFTKEVRDRKRKELKILSDEILLVFATGGTSAWQNNDKIIKLADKGFKILNLSKVNIDHENIITKFVPYKEMPHYLCASDVAFIWRDESIVNKVASPVKVSEYLCCGLPVIHNGTVDMINEITSDQKVTLSIKKIDDLNLMEVKKFIEVVDKKKLSHYSNLKYGISTISESYKNIYSENLN